ncbi:deoxynucleoside triphosphate triphosphohydrolase SAMHD1-like [Clarias gariepinus]|uniref:deoxynucleoside triphosphate triphosphohydrolase SAMHD1-like n=1 Tax=Clarias gariepinus TaxID=13013 RepID=UPI00234C16EC|nr:deoxynucleoside triphosphate triphosphohydrolase SAMHD1-like [Clarias gariepinus]
MAEGSEASGSGQNITTKNYKIFNDSVHGHIKMHPLLVEIIDTPEFQRLRNIKQLGGGYYVFPGASHNRFEHSIGVAHLAGELVRSLRGSLRGTEEKTAEDSNDELCVQIAGLCHDLGHGPFSHVFEIFMKEAKVEWKHEEESVKMFEHLIKRKTKKGDKTIEEIMNDDYNLDHNDIMFIKSLINTDHDLQTTDRKRGQEKSYLYEIVANKHTGIDVDKMDYFVRDCHHLGMKSNFSHERYVMFARVCTNEENRKQICMRDKEALNMYELFHVRYLLHHNAYQHKVKVAVEMMIVDALLAAEKDFTLETDGTEGGKKISEAANDPEIFLKLTDDILQEIKLKSEHARVIIEKIEKRDLYHCVGSKIFQPDELENMNDSEQQLKLLKIWLRCLRRSSEERKLLAENFRVRAIKIDYGKKEENPIDSLRFYSKDENNKAVKLSANELTGVRRGPPGARLW